MTPRDKAKERADADVDHCVEVMKLCAAELWTHYGEVYGHQPVIDNRVDLIDVVTSLRKLITAIEQAQTARRVSVLAAG